MPRDAGIFLLLVLQVVFTSCIEPTEPDFQLGKPFYLIEGRIADQPGRSQLTVRKSEFRAISLEFTEVTDATVLAVEAAGTQVQWQSEAGEAGSYRPPPEFAAATGEQWFVRVSFPDGTVAESSLETVPPPPQLDGLRIEFAQEGRYDEGRDRFLPVFRILVDASDEGARADYYQWDFRYWERRAICKSCYFGVYRDGKCVPAVIPNGDRYDYLCLDVDSCYQVKPGGVLNYVTDAGFSGGSVRGQEIGDIEFIEYGGLLVEAIQYGLTEEAYAYGKGTADLINGSGGLNPTIPAALTGNLRNTTDTERDILGYVAVVSVDTRRRYIERDLNTGTPSNSFDRSNRIEPPVGFFVPPRAPCAGEGRTPFKPTGWP